MIYFIERPDGCIKIGTTVRLSQRLAQLRAEHGAGLKVLAVTAGSFDEENQLHARFSGCRFAGEWFRPAPGLLGFIKGHADAWDGKDESGKADIRLRVDPELHQQIQEIADEDGNSVAAFIRSAVVKEIKRRKKEATE